MVEIVCEGNKKVGFGHIRRSLSLAAEFKKANIPVSMRGLSSTAQSFIDSLFNSDFFSIPKVRIFDSPLSLDNQIRVTKSEGILSVTLDWFGESTSDINIVVYPHHEVRANIRSYVGFEYVIIREDILIERELSKRVVGDKNVLICLGGADVLGQSNEVALMLKSSGYAVTLIQGPMSRLGPVIDGVRVYQNPTNYPKLMASCNWAVTNGGGCFFESACLGKPTFILPQTPWEMAIAKAASIHVDLLGIGMEQLTELRDKRFSEIYQKTFSIIDGVGSERIVNIVRDLL